MSDTARVQLAYEHEGHAPDDVIEVPLDEARRMITEGRARVPDDESPSPSLAAVGVAPSTSGRLSGDALDADDVTVERLQDEIRARQGEGADLKVTGSRDELIKRLHEDDANRA